MSSSFNKWPVTNYRYYFETKYLYPSWGVSERSKYFKYPPLAFNSKSPLNPTLFTAATSEFSKVIREVKEDSSTTFYGETRSYSFPSDLPFISYVYAEVKFKPVVFIGGTTPAFVKNLMWLFRKVYHYINGKVVYSADPYELYFIYHFFWRDKDYWDKFFCNLDSFAERARLASEGGVFRIPITFGYFIEDFENPTPLFPLRTADPKNNKITIDFADKNDIITYSSPNNNNAFTGGDIETFRLVFVGYKTSNENYIKYVKPPLPLYKQLLQTFPIINSVREQLRLHKKLGPNDIVIPHIYPVIRFEHIADFSQAVSEIQYTLTKTYPASLLFIGIVFQNRKHITVDPKEYVLDYLNFSFQDGNKYVNPIKELTLTINDVERFTETTGTVLSVEYARRVYDPKIPHEDLFINFIPFSEIYAGVRQGLGTMHYSYDKQIKITLPNNLNPPPVSRLELIICYLEVRAVINGNYNEWQQSEPSKTIEIKVD